MDTEHYDKLFLELRNSPSSTPDRLAGDIVSKPGLSAESLRSIFLTGSFACFVGVAPLSSSV